MTRARNTADELSLITAKGDLLAGSASGIQSKLAVGSNDTVLTADSTTGTGLKWAAPVSGGMTLLETITVSATSSVTSATISGTYKDLKIYVKNYRPSNNGQDLFFRINGDSNTVS